jgi:hypothetical protein
VRERERKKPYRRFVDTIRYAVVGGPVRKRERKKTHRRSFVAIYAVLVLRTRIAREQDRESERSREREREREGERAKGREGERG